MNKRKAVISLAGYEDIFEDSMEDKRCISMII